MEYRHRDKLRGEEEIKALAALLELWHLCIMCVPRLSATSNANASSVWAET